MFEKGDLIVCLDADQCNNCLTKFKEYTVLATISNGGVCIIDDTKTEENYFASRFVLSSSRVFLIKKMFEEFK